MNHKKILTLSAGLLSAILALSACGAGDNQAPDNQNQQESSLSSEDLVEVDVEQMATSLQDSLTFQDTMSTVDPSVFYALYSLDENTADSVALIASTGATAEEIAVIHATSNDTVNAVMEAVGARVAAQRNGFENYVPEELEKLSEPVIVSWGQYVVLVVSDDNDAARAAVDEYRKQVANQ